MRTSVRGRRGSVCRQMLREAFLKEGAAQHCGTCKTITRCELRKAYLFDMLVTNNSC